MKTITVNEVGIGAAIQRYLEDKGYIVHKLEMKYDHTNNTFSATAQVDED